MNPLLTKITANLATGRTKPGKQRSSPYGRESLKETQATERLYKGALPGTPNNILVSDFEP